MKAPILCSLLALSLVQGASAFTVGRIQRQPTAFGTTARFATEEGGEKEVATEEGGEKEVTFSSDEEKDEVVGNLVADDEWTGLGMELTDVISKAVMEDMKNNARDFLGKEEYEIGDITKEVDTRVKDEIAKMRGKDGYELGDFTMVMDEMSKSMVEDMTVRRFLIRTLRFVPYLCMHADRELL
jgi:hypothetical protein